MAIDHYSTAQQMLNALDKGEISSVELTELHISRIKEKDDALNAMPIKTFDRAREAAKVADQRRAKGETGSLLGIPMTLKESTLVAGLPQTAGISDFMGYEPTIDGKLANDVFNSGANLLGKTNIPVALGDWQADSPVYGRTNNPWDLSRTPGGSTGGGAAALASGMTPLEVGSDIGGSIRVPATYCGVYGHRPSETAIPKSGSFPMADLPNPAVLMPVQGPLTRSAGDLELLFDVLIGAEIGEDAAWRLELPAARSQQLSDFRVAAIPLLLDMPTSSSTRSRFDELIKFLVDRGAKVESVMPEIDMQEYYLDYTRLLNCVTSQGMPREIREARATEMRKVGDPVVDAMADGFVLDAAEFLSLVTRREFSRAQWRAFFMEWDIVLSPMTLDVAFPHQDGDFADRKLIIDNQELPYFMNIIYPMLPIFAGLPSTAFPAGLDAQGLPLGFQAIGPYLEDRTTLKFAQLLEEAWYKFEVPPGY